jgi:large subunit ribosomal protein L10
MLFVDGTGNHVLALARRKDVSLSQEVGDLAITRERKEQLVAEYTEQLKNSSGIILTEYRGLTMANLTAIRRALRPLGASARVVKNRLLALALQEAGMAIPPEWLTDPTAVSFCGEEVPAVARALRDAAKEFEPLKIKGGLLGVSVLSPEQVSAIADLPPRDTVMAQVLGTINAPAGQIAGVIANSVRQILNVLQAYVDKLEEEGGGGTVSPLEAAEPA